VADCSQSQPVDGTADPSADPTDQSADPTDPSTDAGDPSSEAGDQSGDQVDPGAPGLPPVVSPPTPVPPPTPGLVHLRSDGTVWASPKVPRVVRQVIAAANRIAKLPYRYGGGHGSFVDKAYDCSGSVSYALHGGGLLAYTMDSTALEHWGAKGPGRWITVYANKGHAWMTVAGMRFDTGGQDATGSRWQAWPRGGRGFVVRHPAGL
jgi:hypothetical protein